MEKEYFGTVTVMFILVSFNWTKLMDMVYTFTAVAHATRENGSKIIKKAKAKKAGKTELLMLEATKKE